MRKHFGTSWHPTDNRSPTSGQTTFKRGEDVQNQSTGTVSGPGGKTDAVVTRTTNVAQ